MLHQTMDRLKRNTSTGIIRGPSPINITNHTISSNQRPNNSSSFNRQESRLSNNASTPFLVGR